MAFYTNKKWVGISPEGGCGQYQTGVSPTNYPINDVENVSPDIALNEYGRPANAKFTRGRYLSGAQSATFSFTSFMMKPDDTSHKVEPAQLFQMAGYQANDDGSEIIYDGNPDCQTYSLDVITLGCYDSFETGADDTPEGESWELAGAKADFTLAAEDIGAPIVPSFSITAAIHSHDKKDTGTLPVADLSKTPVDRFLGGTLSIEDLENSTGFTNIDVQNWSFAQGNTISIEKNPSSSGGTKCTHITDADPKLTITAIVGDSTQNVWASAVGNDNVGSVIITGNFYTYTFKSCTISSYSEADADGLLVLTFELSVSGNVEIKSITTP